MFQVIRELTQNGGFFSRFFGKGFVQGFVLDSNEQPLHDVVVSIGDHQTKTMRNGKFIVSGLKGQYTVSVKYQDQLLDNIDVLYLRGGDDLSITIRLDSDNLSSIEPSLKELQFEDTDSDITSEVSEQRNEIQFASNGWVFQGNPDYFDVDAYVSSDLPYINWSLKQYSKQVTVGDLVFIWRSRGTKTKSIAGIIALAKVCSEVYHSGKKPNEAQYYRGEQLVEDGPRVDLEVIATFSDAQMIRRDELKNDDLGKTLLIIRRPNNTNYKLSIDELGYLLELWKDRVE